MTCKSTCTCAYCLANPERKIITLSDKTLPKVIAQTMGGVPQHVDKHADRVPAPASWHLPMSFRKSNPWGWRHGEINSKGQLHPGFDFNDGPNAQADMGLPLYAAESGVVTFAKRTPGWGTLIAVKLDKLVDGREVFIRYGHPKDIYVKYNQHVSRGELIGTNGDGYMPASYAPHLHYDIGFVDVLWELTRDRGLGKPDYVWYQQKPSNFDRVYLNPERFHPEVKSWFDANPKQRIVR